MSDEQNPGGGASPDGRSTDGGTSPDGINPELVKLLVCPETHQPLRLARPDELATLNQKQRTGTLRTHAGEPPRKELTAALVRKDGRRAYPIEDGIPVMLIEESLEL